MLLKHLPSFIVVFSALVVGGCSVGGCSDENTPENANANRLDTSDAATTESDVALCARACENLPAKCQNTFDQLKGADCNARCLEEPADPSERDAGAATVYRRCLAEATNCPEIKACQDLT